jgi:uncharacterized protein (DUF111 family)
MSVDVVAYGAGARELDEHPNVLRLAVGDAPPAGGAESDLVWMLETNLDDMTGEEVGYCLEALLDDGALDAFTTPVQMKKGRPGVLLTVLCPPDELRAVEHLLWRHTSTLGVRRHLCQRSCLRRRWRTVSTPWGEVRVKVAYVGDQEVRCEPEYEDCRAIARERGLPLRAVYQAARRAAAEAGE